MSTRINLWIIGRQYNKQVWLLGHMLMGIGVYGVLSCVFEYNLMHGALAGFFLGGGRDLALLAHQTRGERGERS